MTWIVSLHGTVDNPDYARSIEPDFARREIGRAHSRRHADL